MDLDNPSAKYYQGGDAEAVKDRKTGDDAYFTSSPVSSSFTPINYDTAQLPTPHSSRTTPNQQNQARRRATSSTRRRNPAVAQYLGLGHETQFAHLDSHVAPSAELEIPSLKQVRERGRLADRNCSPSHERASRIKQHVPIQAQVSECSLIAKPVRKSAGPRTKQTLYKASQRLSGSVSIPQTITSYDDPSDNSHFDQLHHGPQTESVTYPVSNPNLSPCHEAVDAFPAADTVDIHALDLKTSNFESHFLAQFADSLSQDDSGPQCFDDEDFGDDISDRDLLMLTTTANIQAFKFADNADYVTVQPSTSANLYKHEPQAGSYIHTEIDLEQELRKPSSQCSSKKFTSPVTLTTRMLAASGDLNSHKARKAIVRPPFPTPVRDRSPIIGLSASTLLRTCFRIGEAINQSCQASKSGKRVMIELFARVLHSERTDKKQHFTFCDLFHTKPPYIKAVYDTVIWKSVQLFEYDSRRLLEQGRICRCMGTMKREDKEWAMTVLNVWEATWEDVSWVEGIVGA